MWFCTEATATGAAGLDVITTTESEQKLAPETEYFMKTSSHLPAALGAGAVLILATLASPPTAAAADGNMPYPALTTNSSGSAGGHQKANSWAEWSQQERAAAEAIPASIRDRIVRPGCRATPLKLGKLTTNHAGGDDIIPAGVTVYSVSFVTRC